MRLKSLRLPAIICCVLFSGAIKGQSCIPTGINGAVVNLNCNQVCSTLVFQIPHIKGTDDYVVNTIAYNPYTYLDPAAPHLSEIYVDDVYGFIQTMPFNFCFYGAIYNQFVVGSNGLLTFDLANASPPTCGNSYNISFPIPYSSNNICSSGTPYYPKASIMGMFTDLYPVLSNCPPDRKIAWHIEGSAPCRKLVLNYYHVGMFGNGVYTAGGSNCNSQNPTTFQIVLHESTGIIDVNIEKKGCNGTAGTGYNAILGIQDFTRTKAVAAPGKNATIWNETNTAYRFTPSGAGSRFVLAEMLDMTGAVVATADTLTTVAGLLDVRFQNFCTPPGSTPFVVRTQFSSCEDPTNILVSLDTITINRTNSLGATQTNTNAGCGTGGTITVTIPAGVGTSPYTYILDGGTPVTAASPYTFTNVAAGTHTIVVTDASAGCTSTITPIQINLVGTISETHSVVNAVCPGSATGSITINTLGGVGPYTFSLNGGPAVPGTLPYTFSNLLPNGYIFQVNDLGSGCNTGIQFQAVTAGPGVTGTWTSTPTACTGVNNGTLTVTAVGTGGPYTWSIDGGAAVPGASPYTFTNLSGGGHNVVITDITSGCVSLAIPVNVPTGTGVIANSATSPTSCPTATNGSITVTVTTGAAPYTFVLDGGAPQTGASPYTFNNVAAGGHNIVVTDNNGCTFTLPPATVNAGPNLTGNNAVTGTTCNGASNGTITVTPTGGTAPFSFSLDGGAPQTGTVPYTFNNVAAGLHNVVITDAAGCISNQIPADVQAGPVLTANNNTTATSCSGATNGTITVSPVGGTAPFTFSLDGGAPQSGAAPYTFTNVPAGLHNIVIADASGCVSNQVPADVTAGPQLITTASASPALCNGSATGSITVTVPGMGTAPFQYSLDNVVWQASNVFNGLNANTYTVYYQSADGCVGSTPNIVVTAPASVSAAANATPVVCFGQNNGIINVTANGGVPPYQYSINGGGTWQASNIFNVPANTYTITIRDANNCTVTQPVTVTEPAALTASSATTNSTCNGGANGTITVTAAGGNAGYQYSLDGVNFQASNVFNVTANSYTVTIKDNLGCTTTIPATVVLTNDLTFVPQTDPTICEGTSTQLQLVSNAIQYSWTPATGLSSTTISNPVANPTTTTTYTVTATLGVCTATDVVMVNVNAAPVPNAGPDGFICYGQTYTLQGSGGSQYTWTPSTYLSSTSIPNPVSTPSKTITYTLSQVIDAIGCVSLTTDDVIVDVTPPIKVTTFPYDTVAYAGDQFQLNATSIATNYTWTPATGLSNPNIPNPVVTVGPIGSDVIYQVTASTAAGCKGEGYVRVKVYTGPDIYVPTGFSPNGDGKNDRFIPFPVGIKSITYFRVFNRWGQMVFSTNQLNDGWDGKMGGMDQPTGVYVWMAEGVTKDNKIITKKGTVTLIR